MGLCSANQCIHKLCTMCTVCGLSFESDDVLIKHLEVHLEENHFCEKCGKILFRAKNSIFTTKTIMAKKISNVDSATNHFQQRQTANLKAHVKTFHSVSKDIYSCEKCAKLFSIKSNLKRHQSTCQKTKEDTLYGGIA